AGPLIIYLCLKARDTHFDEVVNKCECQSEVCEADFDGDGIPGRIQKRASDDTIVSSRLLIVTDNGRELLRTPYNYIDGTLRTHVAMREESGKARLLIFDGVRWAGVRIRAVSRCARQQVARTQATSSGVELACPL